MTLVGDGNCTRVRAFFAICRAALTRLSFQVFVAIGVAPIVLHPAYAGSIAGGIDHQCVLANSGPLCWGESSFGKLGDNQNPFEALLFGHCSAAITISILNPVPVSSLTGVTFSVRFAPLTFCGGGIPTPTPTVNLPSALQSITAGGRQTCGIGADDILTCWGFLSVGADNSIQSPVPAPVPGLSARVSAVSIGYDHACAITRDGGLFCWGSNSYGQLGNGTTEASPTANPISGPSSMTAVSAGGFHTCAVSRTGSAYCWGSNDFGQVGDGVIGSTATPVAVYGLSSGVSQIASGGAHSCAITETSGVLCWGANTQGQLGISSITSSLLPAPVQGLPSDIAAIVLGDLHTCALTKRGTVLCWGDNGHGQLGSDTRTRSLVPISVSSLPADVIEISAGAYHTCARTAPGLVLCWGNNQWGSLGDGTFVDRTKPTIVRRENGAGTLDANDWYLDLDPSISQVVPADKTPAFLANASLSVAQNSFAELDKGDDDQRLANVVVDMQFRARDVGQAIFVFAYAPKAITKRSEVEKDDATCVLAQLSPSGQLQQTASSTLQPYVNNVTSAQHQAVTILSNVPRSAVAGATICVGSASTSAVAASAGNYQCVVTMPADFVCVAPDSATNFPDALSGLWWNANESGWGIHFTQRRNIVFAAWYTYDSVGNPKWFVSTCTMPTGTTGMTGTCNGVLSEVNGPIFFGTPFNPSLLNVTTAGNLQLNFQSGDGGSMTYSGVAGQTRTVPITRQPLATGVTAPAINYTDLWWNPNESGWGMAIAQQFNTMFLAWYVYDSAGKPIWYVATCIVNGSTCSGSLLRTSGPAFGPTFNPNQVQVSTAGMVSVSFTDGNNATLTYTVNGTTATKTITRQLF